MDDIVWVAGLVGSFIGRLVLIPLLLLAGGLGWLRGCVGCAFANGEHMGRVMMERAEYKNLHR
ncbi:MAG: hypothetical protein HW380_684 [Magnetococcales bacterium]|nr:hypothetical protein [Magnetococcales bacterium]